MGGMVFERNIPLLSLPPLLSPSTLPPRPSPYSLDTQGLTPTSLPSLCEYN